MTCQVYQSIHVRLCVLAKSFVVVGQGVKREEDREATRERRRNNKKQNFEAGFGATS